MKILDYYILRKFIGTFCFITAIVLTIVIIFDLTEKLNDFLEKKPPLKVILLDYYLSFIPFFINLILPLFVFGSVIFFTARMSQRSEVIAIFAGGVSFYRFMQPYILAALLFATISYLLGAWIIPRANKKRLAFENTYIRNPFRFDAKDIHRQISPGTYVYMESYDNVENKGVRFSLEKLKDGHLVYKLVSESIAWDTLRKVWVIRNYSIREIDGLNETVRSGVRLDTLLELRPAEFSRRINTVETMDSRELDQFIEAERMRGSENISYYLIERYSRISFTFSTLILTLIGIVQSIRKTRGGIGLQIGTGLFISFVFILFMRMAITFSVQGGVPPLIAVWIPNLTFAILAVFLIRNSFK
jgi:lipopolysaccharide export system permease protein